MYIAYLALCIQIKTKFYVCLSLTDVYQTLCHVKKSVFQVLTGGTT